MKLADMSTVKDAYIIADVGGHFINITSCSEKGEITYFDPYIRDNEKKIRIERCQRHLSYFIGGLNMRKLVLFYLAVLFFTGCQNKKISGSKVVSSFSIDLDSSLCEAVRNKDLEIVKKMIIDGADINYCEKETGKPLILISMLNQDYYTSEYLINSGVDLYYLDSHSRR